MPRAPFHLPGIKRALAAGGEMRQAELCKAVDLRASTLLAAVKPGMRSGEILRREDAGCVFYRLADGVEVEPQEVPADDADGFNAALWADGDLVLVGVELNADGRSVTLGPKQVRTLCRLLHGQGPEE